MNGKSVRGSDDFMTASATAPAFELRTGFRGILTALCGGIIAGVLILVVAGIAIWIHLGEVSGNEIEDVRTFASARAYFGVGALLGGIFTTIVVTGAVTWHATQHWQQELALSAEREHQIRSLAQQRAEIEQMLAEGRQQQQQSGAELLTALRAELEATEIAKLRDRVTVGTHEAIATWFQSEIKTLKNTALRRFRAQLRTIAGQGTGAVLPPGVQVKYFAYRFSNGGQPSVNATTIANAWLGRMKKKIEVLQIIPIIGGEQGDAVFVLYHKIA